MNLWLVSSNNFYYCRFAVTIHYIIGWLVSSNNFYYCRYMRVSDGLKPG